MKKLKIALLTTILIFILGCSTTSKLKEDNFEQVEHSESVISLIFAGDIMAHRPNYSIKDFSKIYDSITPIISNCDFAFANIEAPVDDEKEFSTYPNFNMKSSYPIAAINAGFNVFSLVNNHSNDQGLSGMINTLSWANKIEEQTKESSRPVYFEGIKKIPQENISYKIINHNNIKIAFCAITEVLNRNDYKEYHNYVPYTKKYKEQFMEQIKNIKLNEEPDLFILSVHTYEEEYVQQVSNERKDYFHSLLDCGIDIIWANHPHVIQERELIGSKETNKLNKIIMYANGNTISAQRWQPDFNNPENSRDNTGDGLLFFVKIKKDKNGIQIIETKPYYITTYINTAWEYVIKNLDDNFINYLIDVKRPNWASYMQKRKELSLSTKEHIIWQ